jgi:hypothetical protein
MKRRKISKDGLKLVQCGKKEVNFSTDANAAVPVRCLFGKIPVPLKGQSHKKVGEIRPWDGSLGPNWFLHFF